MIFKKRLIEWVTFDAKSYYKIIFKRNELNNQKRIKRSNKRRISVCDALLNMSEFKIQFENN